MTELNGFKIDKFNQYNLQENVKYSTCPLCSDERKKDKAKCLMLDWERGLGTCQHCGSVIQLHTYRKKENIKQYKRPEWLNKTKLSDKIVQYFESRKISQNTLRAAKITESKEFMPQHGKEINTIQFNYFRHDELINIKYRGPEKSFKMFKDAEIIFYNLDLIKGYKECIIVEGEIDCLSYIESGYLNCISVPNGSTTKNVNLEYLDNSYEFLEDKEKYYLALDNDQPGQNVQKELIRRLGPEKCYIIDFEDCKDANEYLVKYGKERLRQTIDTAKQVPLTNVKTYNDYDRDLYNFYANGLKKGYMIGIEPFDNIFSTYLKQFIVVTGVPTHGKSDFVDQMIIGYCLNYNWKGAICSIENEPRELHLDKLIRKIAGFRPENTVQLEVKSWYESTKKVNDFFYFIEFEDGYNLKKILNKVRELIKRYGIKYFVLDPFNKIPLTESLKKDINHYTSDYLFEIDQFCRINDILGIIVAHPRKMGKENGKTIEPDFYDIKGGGEWFDMSPHGLLVYRDFKRDLVKVKVLKCKFQNLGTNNAEIWFKWNTVNGRYTPINCDPDDFEIEKINFNFNCLLFKNNIDKEPSQDLPVLNFESNEDPLPF